MRTELIHDLLRYLDSDGSLQIDHCPEGVKRALEEMPLPIDLKRLLQWYWPNQPGKIGPYYIYSIKECLEKEDLSILMQSNMLQIGCAINGDPLVLCFNEERCAVGLISHDEFWENHTDPEESYAELTGSIDELLWLAAEKRYLPIDFYAASELIELRKEIEFGSDERR